MHFSVLMSKVLDKSIGSLNVEIEVNTYRRDSRGCKTERINSTHTKFNPDLLFSRIAKTYNCRDVFLTTELKNGIIANYADVTEDDGSIV